jgi:hypothetical protein
LGVMRNEANCAGGRGNGWPGCARLDRVPLGPQVANSPHGTKPIWGMGDMCGTKPIFLERLMDLWPGFARVWASLGMLHLGRQFVAGVAKVGV